MADEPGAALAAQYLRRRAAIGPQFGVFVGNMSHDAEDPLELVGSTSLPVRPPLDARLVVEALLLLLLTRHITRCGARLSCPGINTISLAEPAETLGVTITQLLKDPTVRAALFEAPDAAVMVMDDTGSTRHVRTVISAGKTDIIVLSPDAVTTLSQLRTGDVRLARPDQALIVALAHIIAPGAPEAGPGVLPDDDVLRRLTLLEIAIALLRLRRSAAAGLRGG